jgi:excisionase family DNA binding protein
MEATMAAAVLNYVGLAEHDRSNVKTLPARQAGDQVEIVIRHANGLRDVMPVSAPATDVVRGVLAALNEGHKVAVLTEEKELSPEEAAQLLGLSRPLVVRRMDGGSLPFRYVGAHRRCKLSDVLALKQREDQRRSAMVALAEDTDDLAERYGL